VSQELDPERRDAAIARIATRQHGVVTATQLTAAGMATSSIRDRVTAGRLHRLHRGVYAVGHRGLSSEGRWLAGVLAFGDGAVLSHASAAQLWQLLPQPSSFDPDARQAPVHVTVPSRAGRIHRPGVVLHRSATLTQSDATHRHNIPVTSPCRTLADLRRALPQRLFARALRQAEFLRLPLDDRLERDRTRSELEAHFLRLCSRHRLPQPAVNVRIDRFEVDFLWSQARLVAELDGWESHRIRSAFEADRARDVRLKLLGYEVIRFTWRQITDDAAGVARTIGALLRAR
jgi:very-short-patch-repair endonuclease